ncbi:hypothetical protein E1301_Tti022327 [Triplophysa tibetana]|uniref:Uncharacterized protein n=1 Tax=Triplophysa tibetana TaxID=1572043 RepID=A0A5A9PJV0_9TELE|nr:hypothetical protein E1301_Tti022327 [Triplophysa tibetana]
MQVEVQEDECLDVTICDEADFSLNTNTIGSSSSHEDLLTSSLEAMDNLAGNIISLNRTITALSTNEIAEILRLYSCLHAIDQCPSKYSLKCKKKILPGPWRASQKCSGSAPGQQATESDNFDVCDDRNNGNNGIWLEQHVDLAQPLEVAQHVEVAQNAVEFEGAQANCDSDLDSVDMPDDESVDDILPLNVRLAQWVNTFQAVDNSGVPGMDRVDSLAEYLVDLRNQPSLFLTNQQPGPTHKYHLPSSTVGQAQLRRKRKMPSAPTVLSPTAVKPPTPRQLFPAPPPGAQMVMLMPMPVASQGPVLVPASQAPSVSLSSAPSAPAASAGPV